MITNALKLVTLSLVATVAFNVTAHAKQYSPEALRAVITGAVEVKAKGQTPVVMFDLDDTLMNTRERTVRIMRDFAATPRIQESDSVDTKRTTKIQADQILFSLSESLRAVGVNNSQFVQQLSTYWGTAFFTNAYCSHDVENPGAVKYVQLLAQAGAKIVYLTGRDTPRMGRGTKENLIMRGFPMKPEQAVLILKPDPKQDDLDFKKSQFPTVAAMGEVIAAFENEPANINAMADAFPQAQAIFLDTIHSNKPDVPEPRVQWVRDFRLK